MINVILFVDGVSLFLDKVQLYFFKRLSTFEVFAYFCIQNQILMSIIVFTILLLLGAYCAGLLVPCLLFIVL